MALYNVSVNFGGFIGADETYEVLADTEELAEDEAIEMAKDDLTVEDEWETEDGWGFEIGFLGYIGVSETYEISKDEADSQEEAEELALEEASLDLSASVASELVDIDDIDDIDDDDEDNF